MSAPQGHLRAAVAAIFEQQYGVIRRDQALAAGMSIKQVVGACRRGEWERVHESVYRLAGAPVGPEQRLMAACVATRGVVSHRSGGLVHGFDVPVPPLPEITTTRRRDLDGILVHRTRRFVQTQIETIGGFRVTKAERTMIDLAGVLRPWQLEAAFDSALRLEACTLASLEQRIDAHGARGFSGVALLRQLIDNRRTFGIPRSRLEERMWKRFDESPVETPQRNVVVYDNHGNRLGELDLCWLWAKVGVECQSYQFHFGRHAWRRDQVKLNRFTAAGWAVFPATEEEAGPKFPVLLRQVTQALRTAART